jgi:hypothetical protein
MYFVERLPFKINLNNNNNIILLFIPLLFLFIQNKIKAFDKESY